MSVICNGKKLSKEKGQRVMGDKMSYNTREDLVMRFHVSQGGEKANFLDYLEKEFLKQRK